MDSVGAGELPDAGRYGDTGSHTLNHIFERYPQMNLPNLSSLGLASRPHSVRALPTPMKQMC